MPLRVAGTIPAVLRYFRVFLPSLQYFLPVGDLRASILKLGEELKMYTQLRTAVAIAAVVLTALVPRLALAQSAATGTIEGSIADQTGAVLPGVTVVVKNVDTNQTRELVTDDNGRYRATALQPGTYEVSATLTGFQNVALGNLIVQVGQTIPVDLRMRPAGVTEQVT